MAERVEKATLQVKLQDDGVQETVGKIRQSGKTAGSAIVELQKSITSTEKVMRQYGASSEQVARSLEVARATAAKTGLGLETVLKQVRNLAAKNGAAGIAEELRGGLEEVGIVARKAAEEVVISRDLMVEAFGDTGVAIRKALDEQLAQAEAISDTRNKVDELSDRFKILGEGGEKIAAALEGISDPARRVALTQQLWNAQLRQGPGLVQKLTGRYAELNARTLAATGGTLDLGTVLGGAALGAAALAAAVGAVGAAVAKFVGEGIKRWAESNKDLNTGMRLVRAEITALQDDVGGGIAEALDFNLAPYAWEFALLTLRNQAEGAAADVRAAWQFTAGRLGVSMGEAADSAKGLAGSILQLHPALGIVRPFVLEGATQLRNYARTLDLDALGATERWTAANVELGKSIADARVELELLSVTLQGELARLPFEEAADATRTQVLGAARPKRESGGGGAAPRASAFHQGSVKDYVVSLVEEGEAANEARAELERRIASYTTAANNDALIDRVQGQADEFTRKRLELEARLSASAERRQQAANDNARGMLAQAEAARVLVAALEAVAQQSINTGIELAGMLGQMAAGAATAADFGKALVASVANLISTLAPAFVQMGVALFATETGNALGLIVAGGALAAIAGGLSGFASKSSTSSGAAGGVARLERTADRLLTSRDEAGRRPSQTVNVYIGNKQLRGAIVETVADAAGRGQLRLSA